jgi:hypothetical protein
MTPPRPPHPAWRERRHRRLQGRGADPPAARPGRRGAGGDDRGGAGVHHPADPAGPGRQRGALRPARPPAEAGMDHIELARWAELVLVAPATADLMARLAAGLADDLLTTLALATTAPVVLAPAMNHRMWQHPATQHNARLLAARGVRLLGPAEGEPRPAGRPAPGACSSRRRSWRRSSLGRAERSPGGGRWSPPAPPVSPSIRCVISATAAPGAWATRSPRRSRPAGHGSCLSAAPPP